MQKGMATKEENENMTMPDFKKIIDYFSEKMTANHYHGTAMSTWEKHLTGDTVKYKDRAG